MMIPNTQCPNRAAHLENAADRFRDTYNMLPFDTYSWGVLLSDYEAELNNCNGPEDHS